MYYKNRFCIVKYSVISLVVASNLYGAPSGGVVTSGNATINQVGNTTNINQSSQKASINWQDFSIKSHESVNFNQPNANSITLNRVIGNEKSIIDGALNANGQVWILNSNGTLFGKNAKVNTSGLLVTTKNLSDEDFQSGNYNFKGNSKASIENQGDINLNDKAYAVFVANSVINNGEIKVHKGNVHLVGADEFSITLNENQNISLKVNKGVLDALVDNQNLLIANGGNVYLTTNAKNELLKGVVNNTGIIEANSLDDLQSEVILFAHGGTANIDGSIIAKNSFVETSGKNLSVKDSFKIEAKTWLLDPVNMTIESNGGSDFNSGSVSATAIQNALAGTNLELQATNNITVNQNITWSTDKQLKLTANSINVNATINNTNSTNGGVYFNAANTTNKVVFGANGKVVVNNLYQLQWINQALNGKYELGRDIDASATSSWNSNGSGGYYGFNPLGNSSNSFTGTLDGLGFTISDLYINRPTQDDIGLFGYTNNATIKNIGLENVNISGNNYVGGLVGMNGGNKGTISNSYATGSVNGNSEVGGLVGDGGYGTIRNSYATGSVSGNDYVGGLVGRNYGTITNSYATNSVDGKGDRVGGLVGANGNNGTITNSYATGKVDGNHQVGGLLGSNGGGIITNSYATGFVSGNNYVGGLVGGNNGIITNSYAKGYVSGNINVGGLVGWNGGRIENSYATGKVDGQGDSVGGLVGVNFNGGTITNSYATGSVSGNNQVGGLLGMNDGGAIENSYATGKVDGKGAFVGGLVGRNYAGTILNSYATNSVSGNNQVGGLVGGNDGTISNSYATGSVNGSANVGGLVGGNDGTISNSYALGSVGGLGGSYVGGLVGWNYEGRIENSYASGTVTGGSNVGGLVGDNGNNGTISNSYATGKVDGKGTSVGGLVGANTGAITNSYATGSVSGNYWVGGLVGANWGGRIENSYATGSVSGNYWVGGLVGVNTNNGTITNSFYNKDKYIGDGVGNDSSYIGVTGKTTAELEDINTFIDEGWSITADSSLAKGTPVLRNGSWVIYVAPNSNQSPINSELRNIVSSTQILNSYTKEYLSNIEIDIENGGINDSIIYEARNISDLMQ
ncbi:beta strand repeat-containing protein [Aliarcobacter cryaerophilus]|uniref:beta strand repeat-containing protein n=1 Tax=Aliarcobacter cryaerophilus TaxID=28198 RepID=UPI0021B5A2B6|nr:GLUG motif-containing protein [Aliarcobacter cryaerophilus]MCT7517396.1 filamentous hemagglutinin N-terminal domain-containing protein [Aliarcobacter cryaerophilus]